MAADDAADDAVGDSVPTVMGGTPLAEQLSKRELRQVMRAGQEITVPQGWSFIWENTPADAAYLLLAGRVAVWHEGERIAELGPGDIVGEAAMRERRMRTATVSALEPLVMLRFSRDVFARLVDRIPKFAQAVDASVARRLHQSQQDR